jgi:hypothetical protein
VKMWSARSILATTGRTPPLWQREFFDRLLRSYESYEGKWRMCAIILCVQDSSKLQRTGRSPDRSALNLRLRWRRQAAIWRSRLQGGAAPHTLGVTR